MSASRSWGVSWLVGLRTSSSIVSPMTGIAENLIEQGVSAVIAHQFEISDEAAAVFTQHIYEGLAEGVSLEEAVAAARNELDIEYSLEALTPVVFLHNVSGGQFLMQVQQTSSIRLDDEDKD